MRNYVIINGVSSLTIEGLAINILPAITKPLMRNEIEEIDGRDGDLITELGYSAYDKEMEIGLWGNYDIDEIIKFFTGEGTVIFSTEPDKYYNFKILNQIDYDKLLKFRTATVTFHCQPFKYPTDEKPIEVEPVVKTGEGETITIDDTSEGSLQMLLKGNTYQDSTTGKNLLPPTKRTTASNGVTTVVNDDGSVTISGTPTSTWFLIGADTNSVNIPAGTYTFSIQDTLVGNIRLDLHYSDSTTENIFTISSGSKSRTVTTTKTITNIRVEVTSNASSFTLPMTLKLMLESGSSATSWEKYTNGASPNPDYPQEVHVVSGDNEVEVSNGDNTQSTTYPINLGAYELCKIGDYQDRFFKAVEGNPVYDSLDSATKETLDSNEWYLEKKIGKYTLPNNIGGYNQSANWYYFGISNLPISINTTTLICNYFKYYEHLVGTETTEGIGYSSNYSNLLIRNNDLSSKDDYTNWLGTNEPIIYYVLSTPTYTKIEGTLASQLEAVYNAVSYEGQTNIGQTNDDLPFWIEATITFTPPSTIENIGNIYAKPILTITGSGNVGVVLNGIEILQINLGEGNTIAIDVPNLEAYNPNDNTLMNRLVTGDYMKLLIQEGENTLSFNGDVSSYSVTNYTRWI